MLKSVRVAGTTSVYGGGGTSTTFSVPGIEVGDTVLATMATSTNSVAVSKAIVSASGELSVVFTADPGANTTVNFVVLFDL
jgi:hypothetical protein